MRRFLAALILLMPSIAMAGTCGNGYGHSSQILLQKAVGSDQTNFPYPLVGTYSVLKTAANGGQVQNVANNSISVSGPADLVFCDAASAGNALKYEVAYYSATTGAFEIWVQIPTLHTATNDSIYLFVNNSGVSTTQQDLSLWGDANYIRAYHMPDGSSLSVLDSAGNSTTNHSATATTGVLDGAMATTSPNYVDGGSINSIGTGNFSLEFWLKATSVTANDAYAGNGIYNGTNWTGTELIYQGICGANGIDFIVNANDTCLSGFNAGTWYYVVGTRSGSTIQAYLNGTAGTSSTNSSTVANAGSFVMGRNADTTYPRNFPGSLDEVRVRTTASTANWIATNYKTVALPSFQIVGQTFSTPTIVNIGTCASNTGGGTLTCPMLFPVTPGGIIVASVTGNGGGVCSSGSITDTLGLTYTNHVAATVTSVTNGTLCIQSAPITGSGTDALSMPISNAEWAIVYEVKAATSAGVVTSSTTSVQTSSISATSPGNNSLLICNTITTNGTFPNSTTPTYNLRTVAGSDPAFSFRYIASADAIVASGSQSCAFNTGTGGTLAIFPLAAGSTFRKARSAIQY